VLDPVVRRGLVCGGLAGTERGGTSMEVISGFFFAGAFFFGASLGVADDGGTAAGEAAAVGAFGGIAIEDLVKC